MQLGKREGPSPQTPCPRPRGLTHTSTWDTRKGHVWVPSLTPGSLPPSLGLSASERCWEGHHHGKRSPRTGRHKEPTPVWLKFQLKDLLENQTTGEGLWLGANDCHGRLATGTCWMPRCEGAEPDPRGLLQWSGPSVTASTARRSSSESRVCYGNHAAHWHQPLPRWLRRHSHFTRASK